MFDLNWSKILKKEIKHQQPSSEFYWQIKCSLYPYVQGFTWLVGILDVPIWLRGGFWSPKLCAISPDQSETTSPPARNRNGKIFTWVEEGIVQERGKTKTEADLAENCAASVRQWFSRKGARTVIERNKRGSLYYTVQHRLENRKTHTFINRHRLVAYIIQHEWL